jgi:DNA-binding response OmpR family regulator
MPTTQVEKQAQKILIAEDDRFLSRTLQAKFKKEKFDVILAKDGEEVLQKLESDKPDLLLLDLVMPKKSGFEVLEAMQKIKSQKKIPVLIISNLGQESDLQRAKELGADEYLIKANFSLKQIVDIVKQKLAAAT